MDEDRDVALRFGITWSATLWLRRSYWSDLLARLPAIEVPEPHTRAVEVLDSAWEENRAPADFLVLWELRIP